MDSILQTLIDFQIALAASLAHIAALGVALAVLGSIASSVSPVFAYRIKRLGLQAIGACLIVIGAHAIMLEVYGPNVPPALLISVYAVSAILLLQGLLNLLFGPAVGNSVIASLLTSLIFGLFYVATQPFRLLRDLFR